MRHGRAQRRQHSDLLKGVLPAICFVHTCAASKRAEQEGVRYDGGRQCGDYPSQGAKQGGAGVESSREHLHLVGACVDVACIDRQSSGSLIPRVAIIG